MSGGCNECRLQGWVEDIDSRPVSLLELQSHPRLQCAPHLAELLADLYYCQHCGAISRVAWRPRDGPFAQWQVSPNLTRPFFDESLPYRTFVELIELEGTTNSSLVKRFLLLTHTSKRFSVQHCCDELFAALPQKSTTGEIAELYSQAVFNLVHLAGSAFEPDYELPDDSLSDDEYNEAAMSLLEDLCSFEPSVRKAKYESAELRIPSGFRPLYDLHMNRTVYELSREKKRIRTQETFLSSLAAFVRSMSDPDLKEPFVWMPDTEWEWLSRNFHSFEKKQRLRNE